CDSELGVAGSASPINNGVSHLPRPGLDVRLRSAEGEHSRSAGLWASCQRGFDDPALTLRSCEKIRRTPSINRDPFWLRPTDWPFRRRGSQLTPTKRQQDPAQQQRGLSVPADTSL